MSDQTRMGSNRLSQREITMIERCVEVENPTEAELRAFFTHELMQARISEWFARLRAGQIKRLPVAEQEAYKRRETD